MTTRLLALVPSIHDTSPGQRFRLEQWEPWLRDAGIAISWHPFEDGELHDALYRSAGTARKVELVRRAIVRRMALLRTVRDYDAVYVFREAALVGPPILERWIARSGVPYVFDFDDAVFLRYVSPANGYLSWLKFPGKTAAICRWATHVMAGNAYLADYARRVNSRVTVVPTTIDTAKYSVVSRPTSSPPVIGWSGSYSTVPHLDGVSRVLMDLARREVFTLRVIGTTDYRLPGVTVESLPWRSATEVEDLEAIDIGIMPLPDEPWSRGKCGLKALQYMALGRPTICSPVGVNTDIIADGENGVLASGPDEWLDRLQQLLRSPERRRLIGLAGRNTVEARYSAAVVAPRVADIIGSLARRTGRSDRSRRDQELPLTRSCVST